VDNAIADQTVAEDSALSFQFDSNVFADLDGDTLTYTTSTLPAWLSFDASTRTFSGTPANGDVGNVEVTVTADDGNGGTVSDTFTITVTEVPTIAIAAMLAGDNVVNADEDNALVVSGTTTGAENGATVTVTLTDGVNTVTKTATVSNNAWALSGGQLADISTWNDGTITVTANVTNAAGNSALQANKTLTLDNAAPTVTTSAITISSDNAKAADGVYASGETVTAVWDPAGNSDVASVNFDFTDFGGSASVAGALASSGGNAGKWTRQATAAGPWLTTRWLWWTTCPLPPSLRPVPVRPICSCNHKPWKCCLSQARALDGAPQTLLCSGIECWPPMARRRQKCLWPIPPPVITLCSKPLSLVLHIQPNSRQGRRTPPATT
jgi:hypothetical protein